MNKSVIKKIKNGDTITYDIRIPNNFKLFRMRADNAYCFSAFLNDEIWGTIPEGFNDPYDTVSIFHIKKLYSYAKLKIEEQKELLAILCNINGIDNDEYASSKLSKLLVDMLVSNDNIQKQKTTVCACFTEKIDNEIMWAHYANNAKGFALEYDYNKLKEFGTEIEEKSINVIKDNFNFWDIEEDDANYRMPMTIVPAIYDNSKYDMTEYLEKVIENELNNVKTVYILKQELTLGKSLVNLIGLTKSFRLNETAFLHMNSFKKTDWKYEREWRLIAYNMNPFFLNQSIHYNIGRFVPSAIYLGERISEYNRMILIAIARKKGIRIYQMKSKMYKNTMKLTYYEIK